MKHLLSIYDLSRAEIEAILSRATYLKQVHKKGKSYQPLRGKTLGLIFDKSSTRTRISFEVGIYQLGGLALFLSSKDTQLGRGETIADTARVMSRYLDGVVIRTFKQETVEEFARYATIPVINGLTDLLHPCQILSDIFTITEKKGCFEGITVAYIGDGNNVANSWVNAAVKLPIFLHLACPEGYEPDGEILRRGLSEAGDRIKLYHDPIIAVREADIIYTDVWTSMGKEEEYERRITIFRPYQINRELLSHAKKDYLIMHCLPAHRGEEITDEIIEGIHSIVFDQAENRLHVQKAILEMLLS